MKKQFKQVINVFPEEESTIFKDSKAAKYAAA